MVNFAITYIESPSQTIFVYNMGVTGWKQWENWLLTLNQKAIDDATRILALQIFPKHNQDCAIKFMDYVIEKFPFRISTVRTDRGHEFQARFHWHVEDQGIRHVYIKPRTPQLNGKVERSHRTNQTEFYQLLTYTDDVDINSKLEAWENFYNYDRPHISLDGKTPYEVMRSLLK